MALTQEGRWKALGRPLTPARPIRELVAALKAAYPDRASSFGWYADESHYAASPPGDHTPYSADAWPVPDPRWVVFATDVMVTDVGGVAKAQRLFDYWLSEAKAGRAPWIKYLIWQATIYDVRYHWVPQANAGHYDHIHVSVRTDHADTPLGSWSVTPPAPHQPPPPRRSHIMRFTFAADTGCPTPLVERVHVTDGVRYRVQSLAADIDALSTQAGAGAVVHVTSADLPAGWPYARAVTQLCGAPDAPEMTVETLVPAILAALPPDTSGGLTVAEVEAAVRAVFADAAG